MGSSASFGKQFGVCSGSLQLAYRDHLSTWDPWHKFHLSSFNRQYYFQTAPAEHTVWRKTNGIPIWHSVKKNDVKIATIGWQLHCRQEIQIRRHIWLVEFHVIIWQKNSKALILRVANGRHCLPFALHLEEVPKQSFKFQLLVQILWTGDQELLREYKHSSVSCNKIEPRTTLVIPDSNFCLSIFETSCAKPL